MGVVKLHHGESIELGEVAGAVSLFDTLVAGGGTATDALGAITGTSVARDEALMLAALAIHARTGELDARTVNRLTGDVDDLFKLLLSQKRKSRISALVARRHAVDAELIERGGEPWAAAWHGWLALQAAGDDASAALLGPLGRRTLRMAQTRAAIQALLAAVAVDESLAPTLVTAYRLGGDPKEAEATIRRYEARLAAMPEAKHALAWERQALVATTTGRLEALYLLARDRATTPEQLLSLSLWSRAVKGREWWERVLKPSTLRTRIKNDTPRAPGLKATLTALSAIEDFYDAAVSLELRLTALHQALSNRAALASVEHELLVLAGAARALARHSQLYLAAGVIQEYRNLSLALTQGSSDDVLGAMDDLRSRGVNASLDLTAPMGDAGELFAGEANADGMPVGSVRRAGIVAKAAAGMALTIMGTKARLFVAAEGEQERLRQRELEMLAQTLYTTFGRLRGVAMKFGQMLSIAAEDLPPLLREMLGLLTESTMAMPAAAARRSVEAALGAKVEDLFAEWSDAPLAAGSIGQVHRARLKDGRAVAVKVQYPGIRTTIEEDLANLKLIAPLVSWRFPAVRTGDILAECRSLLLGECDYQQELANLQLMRQLYATDERFLIPAPILELSCATVLTMEFAEGESLGDFARRASPPARSQLGAHLAGFMYEGIFRHGLVYGDPQPGNFRVAADGRLIIYDFGCLRRWEPDRRDLYRGVHHAVLGDDRERYAKTIIALGSVPDPARYDFVADFKQQGQILWPFLVSSEFCYTREYAAAIARVAVAENANRHAGTIPADMVITGRIFFGLNHLLALLQATWNWRELLLPLLYDDRSQWPPPREPEPLPGLAKGPAAKSDAAASSGTP